MHEAETLDVLNFEVAAVSRVHSLQLARRRSGDDEDNDLQWASIGLVNLYNAGGGKKGRMGTISMLIVSLLQQHFSLYHSFHDYCNTV